MKVKIFEAQGGACEVGKHMERKVQLWLNEHPDIEIVYVLQSFTNKGCETMVITIFHK